MAQAIVRLVVELNIAVQIIVDETRFQNIFPEGSVSIDPPNPL